MGAWGAGPFENDDGADFLYLAEANPAPAIADAFARVASLPAQEPADTTVAAYAVAAAALVAAAHSGTPSGALDDDDQEWIESHPFAVTGELRAAARAAIERVRHNSELIELWDEAGAIDDVRSELDAILAALA